MKLPLPLLISAGIVAIIAIIWTALSFLPSPRPGGPETQAGGGNVAERVVLNRLDNLPDWLLVAYQRDCERGERCPRGEVKFNQRTITRNPDNTADIWIQVRHGVRQSYVIETETAETLIRFELERLHYRFNCASGEFIVIERLIMGPGETVVARDEPEGIYRLPVRGSATGLLHPIACRGT